MASLGNVVIEWRNGFGNCLFQYCFGRLFAQKYNLNLKYLSQNGRSCYKNPVEYGFIKNMESCNIDEYNIIDIFKISSTYGHYEPFFTLNKEKVQK